MVDLGIDITERAPWVAWPGWSGRIEARRLDKAQLMAERRAKLGSIERAPWVVERWPGWGRNGAENGPLMVERGAGMVRMD